MRLGCWIGIVWCAAASFAGRAAEVTGSAGPEGASVLEQWVRTRQMISKVRSDWVAEREALEQTRALWEGELRTLEAAMSQVHTQSTVVVQERLQVEREKERLEKALEVLKGRLPELEGRVRRLAAGFPEPLKKTVQPLLDRLEGDGEVRGRSAWMRLQTLVTLLNEVEKFQSAVTVHPELRPGPDGKAVRVTVLYLGLGQAWFVDEGGRLAGRGVPGPDGWRWVEDSALAGRIRDAVEVYEGRQAARFVVLPVEVR
ncbi:DUF3450 domain-containing protein [Limisphaera ngatamarikiensis]|uniref:DUF3450 domain-containing protein n=1 Tax=Limisphaera ngatamarikiensis TaxID=1324935 RepID=A0A6M1RYM3_9BACT|nr:DUF3450 family protein [Limisphaera ngatamarikiensis]NGO39852.1 DUF3450 domain-containing protein [Limisphaera ngatamarikiensis]